MTMEKQEIVQEKRQIFYDFNLDTSSKKNQTSKQVSNHIEEYQQFIKKTMQKKDDFQNQKIVHGMKYCYNLVNALPLSLYSKELILRHHKELEAKGIKIMLYFCDKIKIQAREISKHSQIMQIVVTFGYFQFTLNILNFEEENQKFSQPTVQIGSGGHSSIFQYIYNKKRYAIKKNKIKHFNQQENRSVYRLKDSLFEYCIYKLLSVVKLGLKLSQDVFGFDLICFEDLICFNMEVGVHLHNNNILKEINVLDKFGELEQILLFLHDFHIIHCDIKPQNVMYSFEHNRIVLIDFGISDFVSENQGQLTLFRFKGTFQYCNEQMKKLFMKQQKEWIDVYWSDVFSLNLTIEDQIKHIQFYKILEKSTKNSSQYNFEKNIQNSVQPQDCHENDNGNCRNFYLQSKLIFLIFEENQKQIEQFLQKQKIQLVNVLSIFLEIYPTIITFRIYKLFFQKVCQNLNHLNILRKELEQIYQKNSFKTILKYDAIKSQFFKRRFQQLNSLSQQTQTQQLNVRKQLIEKIKEYNEEIKFICYYYFVDWLEKLNFFIINQKIISKDIIFEVVRALGAKVLQNQCKTLSISDLFEKCLNKIAQETQQKIWSFYEQYSKLNVIQKESKQNMQNQINIQTIFKLTTIFQRIFQFDKCKNLCVLYINFTSNITKFFYCIYKTMKLTYFSAKTNAPLIYMTYFQVIYPNNTDMEKQKKYEQVKKIQKNYMSSTSNEISQTTKILLKMKQRVALQWTRADLQQKNLFQMYLQVIRMVFIPRKLKIELYQTLNLQIQAKFHKTVTFLIQKLQNKELQMKQLYRKKLIMDLRDQICSTASFLNLQKKMEIHYKLLQKKNEKYVTDSQTQQYLIKIGLFLINMKLQLALIGEIMNNIRQCNIFGKPLILIDAYHQFHALKLRLNPQTFEQGQNLIVFLLQKVIKRGYESLLKDYKNVFTIVSIQHYYYLIENNDIKQKFYWKIKQLLIKAQKNQKLFYQNLIQMFECLSYKTYLKKQFENQLQQIFKEVEVLSLSRQISDIFWIIKAEYLGMKQGNMKRLETYRKYYKYSSKTNSYKSITKYIHALKDQKQKLCRIQPLNQNHSRLINQIDSDYNQQILQLIIHLQNQRKQDFLLLPDSMNFHSFIIQIYFKTGNYFKIIICFTKITQFIRQLTKIHNKSILNVYKIQVMQFLDSSFFKEKSKEFANFALQMFISTQDQQIFKLYPQILYFYTALIVSNRKFVMTNIEWKGMLKILKLIDFLYSTTKRQIRQMMYVLMIGVTEGWEIVKNKKINVDLVRKQFYIKSMRSSNYCQHYKFQQRYMLKKRSKFHKNIIQKLETMKKI